MTITQKLGLGGMILAAALACSKQEVNPDTIKSFASCTPPVSAYERYFGKRQEALKIDVTGDGVADSVFVYDRGYTFYADGRSESYFQATKGCQRFYQRVDSGSPEALRLLKVHPTWLRDSQGW